LLGSERFPDVSTALAETVVKPDADRQYTNPELPKITSGFSTPFK
jgi:hypothetical protein